MNKASDIIKKMAKDLNWNLQQQLDITNWLLENNVILTTKEILNNEFNKTFEKQSSTTPMHSSKPDVS